MKIRKTLVAAASALAIGVAGTGIANAEDQAGDPAAPVSHENQGDDPTGQTPSSPADPSSTGNGEDKGEEGDNQPATSSSSSNIEDSTDLANEIKVWLGVVTAVIGVLGAIFDFANKWF